MALFPIAVGISLGFVLLWQFGGKSEETGPSYLAPKKGSMHADKGDNKTSDIVYKHIEKLEKGTVKDI